MSVKIAAAGLILLGSVNVSVAQAPPAPSIWKNQRGSILVITSVDTSGAIQGSFTNNAAGFGCKGTAYSVKGQTLASGFYFAVDFPPCYTITSWQATVSGSTIQSNWQLEYIDSASGNLTSDTGSDTFTQVP